jgi:hypothetical protein
MMMTLFLLPNEILFQIASFMKFHDLINFRITCSDLICYQTHGKAQTEHQLIKNSTNLPFVASNQNILSFFSCHAWWSKICLLFENR